MLENGHRWTSEISVTEDKNDNMFTFKKLESDNVPSNRSIDYQNSQLTSIKRRSNP